MAEIQNPEIFNQEIAELEAKLAAKRHELSTAGIESPERSVFKQVVREHASPNIQSSPAASTTPTVPAAQPARTLTQQEDAQIQLLIAHAFTKGVAAAVTEARKTGDPFFVDQLHDRLADEYYAKLLAAHKIKGD